MDRRVISGNAFGSNTIIVQGNLTSPEPLPTVNNAAHGDGPPRASRRSPSPPSDRNSFEVAIICALPLEASTVGALFDRKWDGQIYGKAAGDSNAYSFGVIGHHNVVLAHMPNMGKVAAATAAAGLRTSFRSIKLALVVGICGGAPFGKHRDEILLGDVVISEGLIQYDFGRRFPNNRFAQKDTPRDNLPRPNPEIRAALAKLQAEQSWLQDKVSGFLSDLRQRLGDVAAYPGATEDRLFKSTYQHKHHKASECMICSGDKERETVCDMALELSCEQLGCDKKELVSRSRLTQLPVASAGWRPAVHFGLIASGDTVMKSGKDRDDIAARDGIIAFEMEGVGVWETFPGCLIIKSICDYADSHKSKRWQRYAAATAAAATKAFLENWSTDSPERSSSHRAALYHQESPVRNVEIQQDPGIMTSHDEYTVGWICALPLERAAAQLALDVVHETPSTIPDSKDDNVYITGSICGHNVVIACLPKSKYATVSAAVVAAQMRASYKSIQYFLMVGIGGGVPLSRDIRLGDIVVSQPTAMTGGVIQYDLGKRTGPELFETTRRLNGPPQALLKAVAVLEARELLGESRTPLYLSKILRRDKKKTFVRPSADHDMLFTVDYAHAEDTTDKPCANCDRGKVIIRPCRRPENMPKVHYGLIASGDQVMRDGRTRDELATRFGGLLCFEMEAASLIDTNPCLIIRGICDYSDSHKNKLWQGYAAAAAAAYAKEVLSAIPTAARMRPSASSIIKRTREQERDTLNALLLTRPEDDRISLTMRKGKRVEGTCQWLTTNSQYQEWLEQSRSQILWLSGAPGKGKTMLAIYLTEELERHVDSETGVVLYYFCDNQDERRNTAQTILRGLLHQLLERHTHLVEYIQQDFDGKPRADYTVSRFETLWKIFVTLLRRSDLEVWCVLDALDECEERSLGNLLESFTSYLLGAETPQTRLKLLLLSRPQPTCIETKLGRFPRLDLDYDSNHEARLDVERYINAKVNELRLHNGLAENKLLRIRQELERGGQGTFLWIGFVAEELKGKTEVEIHKILARVPEGLGGIYKRMLQQIEDKNELALIFQWVVLARRPLTVTELAAALNIKESEIASKLVPYKLLLKIVDGFVNLIHYSLKDFLLGNGLNNDLEDFRVWEETHLIIIERCLDALEETYKGTNDVVHGRAAEHPLLAYASCHWYEHLRLASGTIRQGLDFSRRFLRPISPAREKWWMHYWSKEQYGIAPASFTLLHLAAFFGVTAWVDILLQSRNANLLHLRRLDKRDSHGRTPLFWAASRGHRDVVELLLHSGAGVDARDKSKLTPLHAAATGGYEGVITLLLNQRACIEARSAHGDTALSRAIANGSKDIVQLLLEKGANIDYLYLDAGVERQRAQAGIMVQGSSEESAEALLLLQDGLLSRRFQKRVEYLGVFLEKGVFFLQFKPLFKLFCKFVNNQMDRRETSIFEVILKLVESQPPIRLLKAMEPVITFSHKVIDSRDTQTLNGLMVILIKGYYIALAPSCEPILETAVHFYFEVAKRAVNQQWQSGLEILAHQASQALTISVQHNKQDAIRRGIFECLIKCLSVVGDRREQDRKATLTALWKVYMAIILDGDQATVKESVIILTRPLEQLIRGIYADQLFDDLTVVLSKEITQAVTRQDTQAVHRMAESLLLLAASGSDELLAYFGGLIPATLEQMLHDSLSPGFFGWLLGEGEFRVRGLFSREKNHTNSGSQVLC